MSYKNLHAVLIPIEGMLDERGTGLTAEVAAAAIESLAARLRANPESLRDFVGYPVNSTPEDRWILRSATEPRIRKADGGWITAERNEFDIANSLTSDEIVQMLPGAGEAEYWALPEDAWGNPVLATFRSHDGRFLGQADIRDWLADATEGDIAKLIHEGWGAGLSGRVMALDLKEAGDPNAMVAFERAGPEGPAVSVEDTARATAYLRNLMPEAAARILDPAEETIEP